MSIIYGLLLTLDGAIYNLIDYVYDIFDFLAKTNIFSQSDYQVIVDRIFIILGLVMLFVLAYSLLKAVINPDEYAKGENSFANIIKNVIISLIIIIILPTVFTVAFNIQNSILGNDTLGKLILGTNGVNSEGSQYADAGRTMAFNVFSSFFYPDAVYCLGNAADSEDDVDFDRGYAGYLSDDELYTCKELITTSNVTWWWPFSWGSRDYTFNQIDEQVQLGASFTTYSQFNDEVTQGKINYTVLVSTVAGIFLLYVLLNFCFDMAVRVIKLAFYQIIAPIPVVCRILPGEKMKGVFSEWVKQIISLFVEVFVRIAIMYLGIFIINLIVDNFDTLPGLSSLGLSQRMIARALLIMGVVIFIRQAPQLIGKMLNIDTGGMKLGLMDKLAMGGGLLAGAAIGGGITSAFKNYNMTRAQGGGRLSAIKSAIGGAGSSALRSGYNAKGAKNFKDMAGATSKGVADTVAKKGKRELYKANHGGTTLGVVRGHIQDMFTSAKEWSGASPTLEGLKIQQESVDYVNASVKDLEDSARNLIESDANKGKENNYGIETEFGAYASTRWKDRFGGEVDKETGKFKFNSVNGININEFNTGVLRQLNQAKAAAAASGGTYGGFTIAEWEDLINDYSDVFSKEVANQGLLSTSGIANLTEKDRNDLKDVIISGTKLRGAVQDNMTSDFVKKANITPEFISENNSIDIRSKQISDLKDNMKQASTDIGIALAQKRNEEKKKSDDNH